MKKKNKKPKESHRHHYIPQFIIKNFLHNELGFVHYYNKNKKTYEEKSPEDIFMWNDLYRDEKNSPNEPVKIEHILAKYEGEVATILKKILTSKEKIILTSKEHDSLLLFFAIMQLRSPNAYRTFKDGLKDQDCQTLSEYQPDGDLVSLWRRNLGEIASCRSFLDVLNNQRIDHLFKAFMMRDTFGFAGRYLIFAERRGNEDFLLSDVYHVTFNAVTDGDIQLPLMTIFPISPKMVVISACNGATYARQEVRIFDKQFFANPSVVSKSENSLQFHKRKIYEKDVVRINDAMFDLTKDGIVFYDKDKFTVIDRH